MIYCYIYKYTIKMEINNLFKALADGTRIKILTHLKESDMTPSELLQKIKISQPTLSHHLDILKRIDLVIAEREGQFIRYSLNMSVFQMALEFLLRFIKKEKKNEN